MAATSDSEVFVVILVFFVIVLLPKWTFVDFSRQKGAGITPPPYRHPVVKARSQILLFVRFPPVEPDYDP